MLKITVALALLLTTLVPANAHQEESAQMTVSHPWSRATAPSQKTGAVFMEISTKTGAGDRLIGAESEDADRVQIHGHTRDGDIMRMRPVEAVDIPAKGSVMLAPGGFHLMLIGLKVPLFEETTIPITLIFEKAGKVEVEAVIEAAGASGRTAAPMKMDTGMKHGSGSAPAGSGKTK
jgi:copper(I)-binding protein